MDLINISEFDSSRRERGVPLPSYMNHVDLDKAFRMLEESHRIIRAQLPRQSNYSMRSEVERLKSHWTQIPFSVWSPQEMAAAGFFRTGLENSVQCFCCGLVLCKHSLTYTPIQQHQRFNPSCEFIQGKDVGNISIYDVRVKPKEIIPMHVMESMDNEQIRLQSFTRWPVYALVKPCALAASGFFFTGTRDHVQCFSCGGCLGNWEENDDPWKEHAKWFPGCKFLQSNKTSDERQQYIRSYSGFAEIAGTSFTHISEDSLNLVTEHLIRGIHNFPNLTEVTIYLLQNPEVLDHLPVEFERLDRMKKLAFGCISFGMGSIKFVPFLRHFTDLEVLHLSLKYYVDFNGVMRSLSQCKKLKELSFCGSLLYEDDMAVLATTMKNFTSLKTLNLDRHIIVGTETAEMFAVSLGSLTHLETLWLPVGEGMAHAAKLIIEQFQHLPNLQFLAMKEILDDESIAVLGKVSKNGFLKRLCHLELCSNYNLTESGWTTFFETAADMPELNRLDMIRMCCESIKSQAATVTAFVRFVSRMPSLNALWMQGWQLDKDDLSMFNKMKEKHPQSKSLEIHWQIPLHLTPNIVN